MPLSLSPIDFNPKWDQYWYHVASHQPDYAQKLELQASYLDDLSMSWIEPTCSAGRVIAWYQALGSFNPLCGAADILCSASSWILSRHGSLKSPQEARACILALHMLCEAARIVRHDQPVKAGRLAQKIQQRLDRLIILFKFWKITSDDSLIHLWLCWVGLRAQLLPATATDGIYNFVRHESIKILELAFQGHTGTVCEITIAALLELSVLKAGAQADIVSRHASAREDHSTLLDWPHRQSFDHVLEVASSPTPLRLELKASKGKGSYDPGITKLNLGPLGPDFCQQFYLAIKYSNHPQLTSLTDGFLNLAAIANHPIGPQLRQLLLP